MSESSSARGTEEGPEGDVVGYIPRYAIPNVSSVLPTYLNSEQDFIHRTFHTGNYDYIRHLPDDIKHQQVVAARTARQAAATQFLQPARGGPLLRSRPDNQQGLFQVFEYQATNYHMADELASKARVESEAKRIAVGGKEFVPPGACHMSKQHDWQQGLAYPYQGGAYEDKDTARMVHIAKMAAKQLGPDMVSPGTDKLAGEVPTRADAWTMMNNVRSWILKDWAGAEVSVFENHQDCWVVRISVDSIDSLDGMRAYMNVFVRCNELVNAYRLTKVGEFWHTMPDDGGVYYVLRPPWVKPDRLESFFTASPGEQHWSTCHAVQELNRESAGSRGQGDRSPARRGSDMADTALSHTSRLDWGRNFLTGTPAAAVLGKVISTS
ncbi:hypothetical protein V8C86DRAFT_2513496 [Haematococcus lacustris]